MSRSDPLVSQAVRILFSAGFELIRAQREPSYTLLVAGRTDEFEVTQRYGFAVFEEKFAPAQIETVKIAASYYDAKPVLIGEGTTALPNLQWDRFISLFGGPVFSLKPFEPQFREHLGMLGYNRLPEDLEGKPDDLFEIYVKEALEFILGERVLPLGQRQRFKARPDGLVLPSQGFYALYDAKAYGRGYEVKQESLRQFGSYVEDFSKRYNTYKQRLNSFLVISGKFTQGEKTLERRSREFMAKYGVPLCFLTANALGEIIEILSERPVLRRAIDWGRVFIDPVAQPSMVQGEVDTVLGDQAITRR